MPTKIMIYLADLASSIRKRVTVCPRELAADIQRYADESGWTSLERFNCPRKLARISQGLRDGDLISMEFEETPTVIMLADGDKPFGLGSN
jgi:hypothetical protein